MSNPNSIRNILLKKKEGDDNDTQGGKLSMRRLFQQKKELEEKRRYGLAPLAQDTVTHQEISTNVPSAMTEAPWYYGIEGPTLAHQRSAKGEGGDHHQSEQLVYQPDELKDLGKASTYVAGACKNCGSRTHKTKDCIYAKKKVGAVYSGVVSGADWELVGQGDKTKGAKPLAAFDGDVGVDLMKSVDAEVLKGPKAPPQKRPATTEDETEEERQKKRAKLDLFAGKTAQHGGLEIKEVPKYLQNLELDGSGGSGVYFDPKTGSMRGNPNEHDPTKEFQGDLARYRAGDYHHYVEAQHRFLTGQRQSFVDFALDEEVGREKALAAQQRLQVVGSTPAETTTTTTTNTTTSAPAVTSTQDAILQRLYKTGSATTATTTIATTSNINISSSPVEKINLFPTTTANEEADASKKALAEVEQMQLQATKNNHLFPFGSYFDVKTFSWGYKCCQQCGRDAPSCVDV